MKIIIVLLFAVTACGGSSSTTPATPPTLVGNWHLRNLDGLAIPGGGIASGLLVLRSDSSYTLTMTGADGSNVIPTCIGCTVPVGYVPNGTWRDEGYASFQENLSLKPDFSNSARWPGSIENGGIAFAGAGYAGLFFTR
jgi:hypothetical protein